LRATFDSSARTLAALILLGIVNHSVLAGSRVAVSLDALALGASTFTVGVLMALYALLPMLLAVTAGRFCDSAGARTPMLVGCALITCAAAIPWFARSLPALFISAALLGGGFMIFQVATQHATGALGEPTDRARNFGLLALGYSVSGFIGPLIAGFAIDHAGFGAAFGVFALLPLIPLVLLAATRIKLPGPHPGANAGGVGSVLDLLLHRDLRQVFLINALFAIAWDLHMIFVPIYGARIGLTASQIGSVLASFAAATFVIRFAIPWVASRFSEQQVLTAALLVAGAVYVAFPFARSVALLLPLSFCLGLGLGSGQPMVMSLLHTHAPPGRIGEAVGVRMSLVQSMAVVVPLVFGAVGSTIGIGPVFWSVGAGLALFGGFSLRAHTR
jgi:MFS family permease